MRDHPIPAVTDPLQYRAIGIVRGTYIPHDENEFTRGKLVDLKGVELEAVVLGRTLSLMRRHLKLERPHLWVVYPRSREIDYLHLQIAGIWEPSTLSKDALEEDVKSDLISEGDDYFSIRGELIYTKSEDNEFIVKIRQRRQNNRQNSNPFKLKLKGNIPIDRLRHFISMEVRREGQCLHLENYQVIKEISTRGGKRKKQFTKNKINISLSTNKNDK